MTVLESELLGGWFYVGGPDMPGLPPDLTGWGIPCPAQTLGYRCSRHEGHTGRHASGDGEFIMAVWS